MVIKKNPSYLCTRCGTCVAACPQNIIKLNDRNFPYIDNEKNCTHCNICLEVCPGIGINFEGISKKIFHQVFYHSHIGYYKKAYVGYALDGNIRKNASSGGIITSLLISALEQKMIEAAIVVKFNKNKPLIPEVIIADSVEKIKEGMQSKYQPIPLNAIIKKVTKYEKLAIVGTPCQIQGLRKWEIINSKIREKIIFHLGLFCGFGCMEKEATDFLIRKLKIKISDILNIQYRAKDYPGGFLVKLKNGKEKFICKDNYKLLNILFISERCIYCKDFTNKLSDISVGDAFSIKKGNLGYSILIVRSNEGKKLVDISRKLNYVFLEDIDIRSIIESQKKLFYLKTDAREQNTYVERTQIYCLQKIIIFINISKKLWIKLFDLLPFSVFTFLSRIIKRK